jgi:ABC-2 type transport system permease protein
LAGRRPTTIVATQTARKAVRSGVLWGYVFAAYVASRALGYTSTYKTLAQRAHFAATFGSNAGISALIGPAHQIQTVAGFTTWSSLGTLSILGAVWGLLAGTRLLRGEEDALRWELLLAGQTTRRGAAAQALVGLGAGVATLWFVTALITVVVGQSSSVHVHVGSALFFALALVSSAAVFLAAGALTSQLAATRRQAATYAGAALGVCYALRMVADSGTGLAWLRWVTPLGWVEQLQPLTAPQPLALVPIVLLTAVLAGVAVHLAGIRDLGASILPDGAHAEPHTRLLFGPVGLTIRLVRSTVVGWAIAIVAMALLVGFVAKEAGSALSSSSSVSRVISRLGVPHAGAAGYIGVSFLIVALLVALAAAGQVSATRGDEAEGRLDHLLVRPVSRVSWLSGRVGVTAAVLLVSGFLAGVSAWLGAASQHAGLNFTSVLDAGLNVIPPALCILGIGVLMLGIWPRAASVATYGVLAWSFLIELVGGLINANHWLLDTSLFHQMAPAPAVSPNWTSGASLVAVGIAAFTAGAFAFKRRDLAGE